MIDHFFRRSGPAHRLKSGTKKEEGKSRTKPGLPQNREVKAIMKRGTFPPSTNSSSSSLLLSFFCFFRRNRSTPAGAIAPPHCSSSSIHAHRIDVRVYESLPGSALFVL